MSKIADAIQSSSPDELHQFSKSIIKSFLVANATDKGFVDATVENLALSITEWPGGHASEVAGEH